MEDAIILLQPTTANRCHRAPLLIAISTATITLLAVQTFRNSYLTTHLLSSPITLPRSLKVPALHPTMHRSSTTVPSLLPPSLAPTSHIASLAGDSAQVDRAMASGIWQRLVCWTALVFTVVLHWTMSRPVRHLKSPSLDPQSIWAVGASTAAHGRRQAGPLEQASQPYSLELSTAIEAVVAAANAARLVAPSPSNGIQKSDLSPVTVADFAVQAIVLRAIRQVFPNDRICAEEAAEALRNDAALLDRVVQTVQHVVPAATPEEVCEWIDYGTFRGSGGRYWTLDPVDGTKGFLRGEQYAVCLALLEDGIVKVGVQGCPNLLPHPGAYKDSQHDASPGALFYAILGHGAYTEAIPEPGSPAGNASKVLPKRLQLPEQFLMAPEELRFCESVEAAHSSHEDAAKVAKMLGIVRPSLRMDSQAKYCCMARGDAQVLLRLPGGLTAGAYKENIWDQASGSLILHEAGGAVSDQYGKPLDFSAGYKLFNNKGVIAATHKDLLQKVVNAVGQVIQSEGSS